MGMKIEKPENFIEITQEINGREPILPKICITANVQERDFTLQNFLFLQNCAET
jgi:hypothetical protein